MDFILYPFFSFLSGRTFPAPPVFPRKPMGLRIFFFSTHLVFCFFFFPLTLNSPPLAAILSFKGRVLTFFCFFLAISELLPHGRGTFLSIKVISLLAWPLQLRTKPPISPSISPALFSTLPPLIKNNAQIVPLPHPPANE